VCDEGVVVAVGIVTRAGVDDGLPQPRHGVQELVSRVLADLVGPVQAEIRSRDDLDLGVEAMADPAQPHGVDRVDAIHVMHCVFDPIDQVRVHAVHQAPIGVPGRTLQHPQDHDRDHETDDRVGPLAATIALAVVSFLADIHDKTLEITGETVTVEASPAAGAMVTLVGAGALALTELICIVDPQ